MTMQELIPQLHKLSRDEKLKVIEFLVRELKSEEPEPETLVSNESVFLSERDWGKITDLITDSQPPNQDLISAFERYKKEVGN